MTDGRRCMRLFLSLPEYVTAAAVERALARSPPPFSCLPVPRGRTQSDRPSAPAPSFHPLAVRPSVRPTVLLCSHSRLGRPQSFASVALSLLVLCRRPPSLLASFLPLAAALPGGDLAGQISSNLAILRPSWPAEKNLAIWPISGDFWLQGKIEVFSL